MTGHHAAAPGTYDAIVDDYVTQRARDLIRQFDAGELVGRDFGVDVWCGQAVEVLRELTRDA